MSNQKVELDLFADEPAWTGHFDRLEVWRSRSLEGGPYEPLTTDTWRPARIPSDIEGTPVASSGPNINLAGRTLELEVCESISISIAFTGPDPITWGDAAAQITTSALGLVRSYILSTIGGLALVVESEGPGLQAILRVVGGDAAPLLGLPTTEPDSVSFGRDPRIPLISGHSRYAFTDPNGAPEYFYKTRYFNSTSRKTSGFSLALRAPAIARLGSAALVRGVLNLADAAGNPVANRTVLVHLKLQAKQVEGRVIVGGPSSKTTDKNGTVEFMLVRGTSITVSVAGTDLARDVDVPRDPTIERFNLLDPAYGKDDLFAVQRPNISYAARRAI
jgi:hypothetical protein